MPAPKKPATTPSLPGANSTRTDGGIASKQAQRYIAGMPNYGDGQELSDLQASAPMAATPSPAAPSKTAILQAAQGQQQASPQQQAQQVTPLSAPTQRPNEPVTTGSPLGLGAGPEAIGINPGQAIQTGTSAKNLVQTLAANKDASPALQQLASKLGK